MNISAPERKGEIMILYHMVQTRPPEEREKMPILLAGKISALREQKPNERPGS
jgi:hypothetical protein